MKIDERCEMLTIGLLGGMSWESTLTYYQAINQGVKAKLGGLHSAKIAMLSIDFAELEKMQIEENWSCLLYTSPSPRDLSTSRMPSSA